jgi:hypothetical protein
MWYNGIVELGIHEYLYDNPLSPLQRQGVVFRNKRSIDGVPYAEVVELARKYVESIGGFEKFAEWGLY